MPSDAQRLDKICQLIDDGRENEVLISHDIHTKHRLVSALLFALPHCTFFILLSAQLS